MTNAEIIAELKYIRRYNYTLAPEEVFYRAIRALSEQKRGHWIDETSGYAFNAKCSECRYIVHEQYYTEYKYCPKCGAKME